MKKVFKIGEMDFVKIGTGAKKEKFYHKATNNLLIIRPFDGLSTEDVMVQLMEAPANYIVDMFYDCENVVIEISAIEMTTSDFRIFADLEPEKVKKLAYSSYNEVIKFLNETYIQAAGRKSWKYTMVFEGIVNAVHFIEAGVVAERTMDEYDAGLHESDENGFVVAHINGNSLDNRAENLQWVKVC